ncbi:MAG: hypothetical protein R6U68_08050 [Desulfobacteraceae bacterium]
MDKKITTIFFLTKGKLQLIAADNPGLGFKILWKISRIISQRLRNTTGKLIDYI